MSPTARVVLVHAMNSTVADHWYGSFALRLAPHAAVAVPHMPDPFDPKPGAWHATLERAIGVPDASTLIVAHSIGNAATLQYLSSLPSGWELGGLINVGGFSDPQPGNPATPPFVTGIDHERIRAATAWRQAVVSTNDPKIPSELTARLAERLDSTMHHVEGAGHFRGVDGYRDFPLLEDLALEFAGRVHGAAA
jgi:predicted alpha/beta hydrolase family esterase